MKKKRNMAKLLSALCAVFFVASIATSASAASRLGQIAQFDIPEAYQGIGADGRYFYAVHKLVETIPANIRGQGIAWDRSDRGVLYGIIRAKKDELSAGGSHKVTVFRLSDVP